jgi:hypothetical protein
VEGVENPNTLRYFVIAARNFLEYNDIEISPHKFRPFELLQLLILQSNMLPEPSRRFSVRCPTKSQ